MPRRLRRRLRRAKAIRDTTRVLRPSAEDVVHKVRCILLLLSNVVCPQELLLTDLSHLSRSSLRNQWAMHATSRGYVLHDMSHGLCVMPILRWRRMLHERHGLCRLLLLQHVPLDNHHHLHDHRGRLRRGGHHHVRHHPCHTDERLHQLRRRRRRPETVPVNALKSASHGHLVKQQQRWRRRRRRSFEGGNRRHHRRRHRPPYRGPHLRLLHHQAPQADRASRPVRPRNHVRHAHAAHHRQEVRSQPGGACPADAVRGGPNGLRPLDDDQQQLDPRSVNGWCWPPALQQQQQQQQPSQRRLGRREPASQSLEWALGGNALEHAQRRFRPGRRPQRQRPRGPGIL